MNTLNAKDISNAAILDKEDLSKYGEAINIPDDSRYSEASAAEKAVFEDFEQRIFRKLRFPPHWEQEGVSQPHVAAKEKGLAICKQLFKKHCLMPSTILPSIEEGIYISYDKITDDLNKSMIIEVYNTMDIALIICDNVKKATIHGEDVSGMNFNHAVSLFKAYTG
ncbi:hypothetical protein R80B4_02046 [Fibrobacteres bacterium R8-0-B4]